ncbi:MAG: winged helix-turn-helix domain-containing protein [bacterium]
MNLKKVNIQKKNKKKKILTKMNKLITKNPDITNKELQESLKLSLRSVQRYKKLLESSPIEKKESISPISEKTNIGEKKKSYWVHCPKCGVVIKITPNPIQTGICMRCGLEYDRKNSKWISLKRHQYRSNARRL